MTAVVIAIMNASCVKLPSIAPEKRTDNATPETRSVTSNTPPPATSSLEALEADPSFLATKSSEARAARLSELWLERAEQLEEISLAAKLSALLRSSHIALTSLLGDGCRNPFNKTCGELDKLYRQTVQETARTLARIGWTLPDLAPTRHRFALEDAQKLSELRAWRIRLEEISTEFDLIRPGIGLATVGCRAQSDSPQQQPAKLTTSICSPITFVLRFDQPLDAEQITAHIDVADAYQQSVLAINGEDTLLAGNIDAALMALERDLTTHTTQARLYCLSLPTRETTTTIALGNTEDLSLLIQNEIRGLLRDSVVRDNTTFCFYPISNDAEPSAKARALLAGVRELITPRRAAKLERTSLQMFFIATGQAAQRTTTAALRRIQRQSRTAAHQRAQGARILPRGVYVTHQERPQSTNPAQFSSCPLGRAAEELHIPITTAGTDGKSLFSTLRALSVGELADTPPPRSTPIPEPISLSPVM